MEIGKKDISIAENFENATNSAKKKIIIIDDFENKDIEVFSSISKKVPHGEVVEKFLLEDLPEGYEVERCNVGSRNIGISDKKIYECFEKTAAKVSKGEKIEAVNLSIGNDFSFDAISEKLGTKITPENLAENKEKVKSCIINDNKEIAKLLTSIEKVANQGVKVYTSAGNSKNSFFNTFSLLDRVKTVGAKDITGRAAEFSANNSLVTNWEQGVFQIKATSTEDRKIGCDTTGNGAAGFDPPLTNLLMLGSESPNICSQRPITGTSYSTPKALINDIKPQKRTGFARLLTETENRLNKANQ